MRAHASHFVKKLLEFRDADWLREQRARWVPVSCLAPRNSVHAGRTGTRSLGGRPQVRWVEGVEIAACVLQKSTKPAKGNNSLTIGSIVMRTAQEARAFWNTVSSNM